MSSGDTTDRLCAPHETPGDPRSTPRIVVAAVRRGFRQRVVEPVRLMVGSVSRAIALRFAMIALQRRPLKSGDNRWRLRLLSYGWGNPGWRASEEYLLAIVAACNRATGPVLEIGSGVSTVVAATALANSGTSLTSIEHLPDWSARVRRAVAHFRTTAVLTRPIVAYDDYDWYDVRPDELERGIQLVICDGPPGVCRGGRYGLLPVVSERLAPGAVILLDDASRPGEKDALARWQDEFGAQVEVIRDVERAYAKVVLP